MTMQKTPSSRKKASLVCLIIFLAVCIFLSIACGINMFFSPNESKSTRAPQLFPDTEIVFSTENELGFMNADGSDVSMFPFTPVTPNQFVDDWWGHPLVTGDGKYLIIAHGGFPSDIGDIYIAPAGEFAVLCKQWQVGFVQMAADQEHILFNAYTTIQWLTKYSPEDCGTDNPPTQVYNGITGALSPDEQYSAEVVINTDPSRSSDYLDIVLHQIGTGIERTIESGYRPAWSRDSQWLAYTGLDGIYVVNVAEGSQPRRLVSLRNPNRSFPNKPLYDSNFSTIWVFSPPMVSWSPDGQWLIYHMLRENLGENAGYSSENYSIYKVNVITGEVIKLIDGGWTPSWRWPAQP
jgi:hypothetical protein